MTTSPDLLAALTARLDRLERQNRNFRRSLLACAAVGVIALLTAQAGPRQIEAEQLVIRDPATKRAILLGDLEDGDFGVGLLDKDSKMRGMLMLGKDNAGSLTVVDPAKETLSMMTDNQLGVQHVNHTGVLLSVDPKADDFAAVTIHNNGDKLRAVLGGDNKGDGTLELYDAKEKVVFKAPK